MVKQLARANNVTDDEVLEWNIVRFWNEIQYLKSENSLKEYENFLNT